MNGKIKLIGHLLRHNDFVINVLNRKIMGKRPRRKPTPKKRKKKTLKNGKFLTYQTPKTLVDYSNFSIENKVLKMTLIV